LTSARVVLPAMMKVVSWRAITWPASGTFEPDGTGISPTQPDRSSVAESANGLSSQPTVAQSSSEHRALIPEDFRFMDSFMIVTLLSEIADRNGSWRFGD
jgi:hypothetical protein